MARYLAGRARQPGSAGRAEGRTVPRRKRWAISGPNLKPKVNKKSNKAKRARILKKVTLRAIPCELVTPRVRKQQQGSGPGNNRMKSPSKMRLGRSEPVGARRRPCRTQRNRRRKSKAKRGPNMSIPGQATSALGKMTGETHSRGRRGRKIPSHGRGCGQAVYRN